MKEEFGDYLKVAQARARIAELEAHIAQLEEASRWRPMREAPRDGTEVLIWCLGQRYEIAVWGYDVWIGDSDKRYEESQVSAWRPLPAPPEGGAK